MDGETVKVMTCSPKAPTTPSYCEAVIHSGIPCRVKRLLLPLRFCTVASKVCSSPYARLMLSCLAVQRSEQAPILLFNEADGILGIRQEGAQRAVDKMENSIQNIILQEMETLDGILIATTNLTQNLDPAFERRFLYKICFEKPDASVREKIWHTMLPSLTEEQCAALASDYDLSGGQMENVARKFSINSILYGSEKSPMDILQAYCNAEKLDNQTHRRIGF